MTPNTHTNQEFFLDVGDGHTLYVQDWGNKNAKLPIIFLHGGPGNGVDNRDRKKFDPVAQRVIFFDQRGSGKSTPVGSLEHNTTQDLVEDITKIADKLSLEKFVLTGGSWGSCLALTYSVAHPQRVAAIVINGVFTGSHEEINWLGRGGYKDFFPEVWQEYIDSVPPEERSDPTAYHLRRALGSDPEAAKSSAYAYERMELALLKLDDHYSPAEYETYDPKVITIEMHYMANQFFIEDNYILSNAARLTIPVYMVQGRYDMVCRPITAYQLHKKLPQSRLIWTINGHLNQHEASNIMRLLLAEATEGNE